MDTQATRVGAKLELCLFALGDTRYGVPLSAVQEFVRMPALTPLPNAPVVIPGVINLRGRAVPVVDLRTRFQLKVKEAELSDYLLVVHTASRVVGLWVDHAIGTCEVPAEWVTDASSLIENSGYISAVGKLPDGLVLIHDLTRLLAESERDSLDSALAATEQDLS